MSAPQPVVIGLVITLPFREPDQAVVLAALASRPELRLGQRQAHLLPLTAETADPGELHRALEQLPGVRAVDVAFVEVSAPTPAPSSRCS